MPLSLAEVLSYSNIGFRFGFKFSFKIFSTRMEKSTMSTSSNNNSPQFPNSKASMLGMVGGGQLGRMFVHEAQRMGYNGPFVAGLVTLSTLLGMASLPFALGILRAF